jgi:hypothetical protein
MVDYTRGTGSSGTMMIRDTGLAVQYWLKSGNNTTWSDHIPWNGTINGASVGGSFNYPQGNVWRMVGSWNVYTNQTVHFNLGNTGTSGFGGPTPFSIFIQRATVPPAPNPVVLSAITSTSMHANFSGNGDGGSSIFVWQIGWGLSPDGPQNYINTFDSDVTGLSPGTKYYFWARGQNAQGYGNWSIRSEATTLRAPDAPSSPVMSNVTQVSATATFNPNFDGGSAITGYRVGWGTSPSLPTSTTSFSMTVPVNLSGLAPGEKLYFFTQARNAIGDSVWSAPTLTWMIAGAYVTVIESDAPVVKRAVPYVRQGGVWKVARPWGRVAGVWKETT